MQAILSARRRRATWTPIACRALGGGSSPQTSSMRWSFETVSPTCRTRSARIARCRPLPILIGPLGPMASSGPRTLNSIAAIVAFRVTHRQRCLAVERALIGADDQSITIKPTPAAGSTPGSAEPSAFGVHGGHTMNDNRLPDAVIGRLSRVRTLESQLVDRLEELRTDTAIDRAPGE